MNEQLLLVNFLIPFKSCVNIFFLSKYLYNGYFILWWKQQQKVTMYKVLFVSLCEPEACKDK